MHLHIVGARPNFMKAAPVCQALAELGVPPLLVHTGQHYDHAMSRVFFEQLGLPKPDRNLGVGSGTHAQQTATLMVRLEELFEETKPDRVVVYGDINSTVAAALVAAKMEIPTAHVEAGLRSFDRTMPEEVNRIVTDALSDVHFVTSHEAVGHLAREGVASEGIHFVGNPMIDTLLRFRPMLDPDAARGYGIEGSYGVATLHRPANVDNLDIASEIVRGLEAAARLVPIVMPLHPRGRKTLEAAGLTRLGGVRVIEPLGYIDFVALVAGAAVVLTDSGGIQEETTVLGVPCLTLRENTERPITITMGTNRLVARDAGSIEVATRTALTTTDTGTVPPLWDGAAGKRIAAILHGELAT